MREQSQLLVWKGLALLGLGGCGYLYWAPHDAGAAHARHRACAQTASAESFFLGMNADDARAVRSPELEQLIAAVEAAASSEVRCAALSRLARSPELDARGLDVVASYTAHGRAMDERVCATNALGEVFDGRALTLLVGLADDPALAPLAVDTIARRDELAAREALIALAKAGPRMRRLLAANALASLGASEATPLIVALLADANQQERYTLISALGKTHDPNALAALKAVTLDGTRSEQFAAIGALGEFGGAAAARTLLALLNDRPGLAPTVMDALARTHDEAAQRELVHIAQSDQNTALGDAALRALASQDGEDARALMHGALQGESYTRIDIALDFFGSHADRDAVAAIAELAEKGGPRTTQSAIAALARIGGDDARESLVDIVNAGGANSGSALSALAQLPDGAEQAFDLALISAKHGGPQAYAAIEVLANDARPSARQTMIELARHADLATSSFAIAQLGQRRSPEGRRVLEDMATSAKTPELRANAINALVQSGDPAAASTLEAVLHNARGQERVQAALGLVELGGPNAERMLIDASRNGESDPEFVAGVSSALAQVGSPAALARLEQLATGSAAQGPSAALGALAQAAPGRAAPIAEAMAHSSDSTLRMGALGYANMLPEGAAQRILHSALRDQDPQVVRQAMESLSWLGTDRTAGAEALDEIAQTTRLPEDVRARAKELLRNFEPDGDRS